MDELNDKYSNTPSTSMSAKGTAFKETSLFIEHLKNSKLLAQCPYCNKDFEFPKATLFDGNKKFPPKAEAKKQELQEELDDRLADLKDMKIKADTGAEKKAISVGMGKIIEKVLPIYKNFNMTSSDCRFLADPIDMIVFDGASNLDIKHITFMDIKTGNASLNKHQRIIKDAILDHNVKYEGT